jgi:hypothetical protein
MYGQSPNRVPRSGEDRLLERLKSLEQRLAGIERRGQSSTWSASGVAGHAPSHAIDGSDPLDPADIGAAEQGDLDALTSTVNGLPTSYAETITGDAVETVFTVTHNQGTRDCIVAVRENASPWALIQAGYALEYTSTNAVTITWDTAPASGAEYRVIVLAR